MNHAVVTEFLADYLEGDLALDKRALVDAHLDTCPSCAQEVREMQQTIRLLRALPEPEVPPMIAANVMRRIRAGETQPSFFERIERALGGVLEPSFVLPASAVAVAALVVAVIQGGETSSPRLGAVPAADQGIESAGRAGEVVAGRLADADEAVRGGDQEGDRTFGASAAETPSAAPRELAQRTPSGALRASRESEALEAAAPMADQEPAPARAIDDSAAGMALAAREPMPGSTWAPQQPRSGDSAGRRTDAFFGGGLAQGFASEVSGPARGLSHGLAADSAAGVPVTVTRRLARDSGLASETGGEDPRDVWLARALENPSEFARYIAGHNLAEQELWVARLGERAQSRGLLGELIAVLRSAGDEKASWLADDFAAQTEPSSSGEATTSGVEGSSATDDPGSDLIR